MRPKAIRNPKTSRSAIGSRRRSGETAPPVWTTPKHSRKEIPVVHSNQAAAVTDNGTSSEQQTCDFYKNPPILSRLILQQKYTAASRRLASHPNEARIWICRSRRFEIHKKKRDPPAYQRAHTVYDRRDYVTPITNSKAPREYETTLFFKALPLHMACHNLALYAHTASLRPLQQELEKLIMRLIKAYPVSCKYPDLQNQYPLHMCVRSTADIRLVTRILITAPSVMTLPDGDRVTVAEYNQLCTTNHQHRERIDEILQRGRLFWEAARLNAIEHRKEEKNQQSGAAAAAASPDDDDDSTVWSEISTALHNCDSDFGGGDSRGLHHPVGWSQLERRGDLLEQLLAEALQVNRKLQRELLVQRDKHPPSEQDSLDISNNSNNSRMPAPKRLYKAAPDDEPEGGLRDENQRLRIKVEELTQQNRKSQKRIVDLEKKLQELFGINSNKDDSKLNDSYESNNATCSPRNNDDSVQFDSLFVSNLTMSGASGRFFATASPQPPLAQNKPAGKVGDSNRGGSPVRRCGGPQKRIQSPVRVDLLGGIASPVKQKGTRKIDYFYTDDVEEEQDHTGNDDAAGSDEAQVFVPILEEEDSSSNQDLFLMDDNGYDDDDDLDSILAGAQDMKGSKLSPELVKAWNSVTVSSSFGSSDDDDLDASESKLSRILEGEEGDDSSHNNGGMIVTPLDEWRDPPWAQLEMDKLGF